MLVPVVAGRAVQVQVLKTCLDLETASFASSTVGFRDLAAPALRATGDAGELAKVPARMIVFCFDWRSTKLQSSRVVSH